MSTHQPNASGSSVVASPHFLRCRLLPVMADIHTRAGGEGPEPQHWNRRAHRERL